MGVYKTMNDVIPKHQPHKKRLEIASQHTSYTQENRNKNNKINIKIKNTNTK